MLPPLDPETGYLPRGIHEATWQELAARFGFNAYRRLLLDGLLAALRNLAHAGCESAIIDGSFVTAKSRPGDYDGTWEPANVDPDRLDPVLLTFDDRRAAMKAKYLGELFPATSQAAPGKRFDEFFQQDKASKTRTSAERRRSVGFKEPAMIKNERQYRITKAEAIRFRQTLAGLEADGDPPLHPRIIAAERQALESQLDELVRDIEDYENLKSGKVSIIRLDSLEDLSDGLIQARVACGLSQKALAERLGLKEQQIQRYEAEGYRSASLQRLSEIADAMGVIVREEIEIPGDEKP